MNDERIERILAQFNLPTQQLAAWRAFGNGHINDTYRVDLVDCPQAYVLQRINTAVFPDANILMDNIVAVTSFLKKRIVARGGDSLRETVTLVPTTNKKWFVTDDGDAFRAMLFIPDAVSHENATTPELFYQSAVAFGGFQKELADFDATQLTPVIDKFHDTRDRLATFQRILAADTHNRAKDAEPEIAFILERATECAFIADRLDDSLELNIQHLTYSCHIFFQSLFLFENHRVKSEMFVHSSVFLIPLILHLTRKNLRHRVLRRRGEAHESCRVGQGSHVDRQ